MRVRADVEILAGLYSAQQPSLDEAARQHVAFAELLDTRDPQPGEEGPLVAEEAEPAHPGAPLIRAEDAERAAADEHLAELLARL